MKYNSRLTSKAFTSWVIFKDNTVKCIYIVDMFWLQLQNFFRTVPGVGGEVLKSGKEARTALIMMTEHSSFHTPGTLSSREHRATGGVVSLSYLQVHQADQEVTTADIRHVTTNTGDGSEDAAAETCQQDKYTLLYCL
ncbi:hypothetical protein NL108_012056 [Boleophthalmus pectinirostris]|nr:hypothetical protein NL108_012056 [Boleophthalmus pectinirostris]